VFLILLSIIAAVLSALLLWLRRWNDPIQAGKWPRLVKLMVAKAKDHACPYGLPTAIAALAVAPQVLWPG
jgi:Flp pilus assembly protein protease CpaA